jgi:hypothetical protein
MPFVRLDRGGPAWSFQQDNGGQADDQPDADDPEGVDNRSMIPEQNASNK